MKMEFIQIKGWKIMQHYKKRTPPWIKLHRDILRDYTFSKLTDLQKLLLITLQLLASQMDNKIPNDLYFLTHQLPIDGDITPEDIKVLIDFDYVKIVESDMLASCYTDAIPETESKAKAKKETYTEDSDEMKLSRLLFDLQLQNFPGMRKPNLQSWCEDARKLIHLDGVAIRDVEATIRWVVTDLYQRDGSGGWRGWAPNIRSMKKLREKWDDLCAAKAKCPHSSPTETTEERLKRMEQYL